MKVRVLVVVGWLISLTCACFAQDVIVTKDARKINAKVTEVNVDNIKYRNFDNLDGPTYTLLKSDIVTILYQNGQVETFETDNSRGQVTTPTPYQTQTIQTTQKRNYYTKEELVTLMKKEDPTLYQRYHSGHKTSVVGRGLLFSGVGLAAIGGVMALTGNPDAAIVFTDVGVVSVVASIPVMIIGSSKKRKAINIIYHRKYIATQITPHFQLNLHSNSMGLAYVF